MPLMKKCRLFLFAFFLFSFSGCDFINSISQQSTLGKAYMNAILAGDSVKCIAMMDIDSLVNKKNRDSYLIKTLKNGRTALINNLGQKVEVSFMSDEQTVSFGNGKKDSNNTS